MKNPINWNRMAALILACIMSACFTAGCAAGKVSIPGSETKTESARADRGTKYAEQPEERQELTGEPIRIGAIYALSGNNAAIGTNILRGIDFAAEDINASGGVDGRPIEIVRGDTQGDENVARSVAERLIIQEKVHAIVGCHQSTLTEIVSQVCEEYKIPMITAISTVDSISTHHNEYFFRLCPMNSLYLENMFMYMREQAEQTGKEVKTIAVFADNSMIGQEAIRCARLYACLLYTSRCV